MKLAVGGAVSILALGAMLSCSALAQSGAATVAPLAATPPSIDTPSVQTAPNSGTTPEPKPESKPDVTQAQPAAPTLAMEAAQRVQEIGRANAHADDIAALKAFYSANPDKPLWIEGGSLSPRAKAVMTEIGLADDWGLKAAAFALPAAGAAGADAEVQLSLAVLKYARHARGGRLDPTQLTDAIDRTANLIAPDKVLADISTAAAPEAVLRKLHPQHPQFERLRQLYLALRDGKLDTQPAPQPEAVAEAEEPAAKRGKKKKKQIAKPALPPPLTAERVLFNMEQWRWMPDDLGRLHVMVNIPEFQLRMVKDGKPIHVERVVTGGTNTQTPIFSKEMETVVFQPGWGVPPSIKVKELLPGLLAGRDTVGSRGYRMSYRGREVSASSIDWRSVDIRKVSIVQPPGPSNALGMVKFLFPNKHDVYMHDTPSKSLFNAEMRAFSHGCVRVRNPMRFAEIIFAETGGWAPQRVASLARGKPENQVQVPGRIGVHITYFTVVVDDDGKVNTYRDIYGHEARVQGGLDGRLAQVARKSQDLGAVRSSLIGRATPRRVAENVDPDRPRGQGRGASRSAPRNGGGGFFPWIMN